MQEFEKIKQNLSTKIAELRKELNAGRQTITFPVIRRLEIQAPAIDPLQWLQGQDNPARIYWLNRDAEFEMAGVGAADEIDNESAADIPALFLRMRETLAGAPFNVRYYGGLRFDFNRRPDSAWTPFNKFRFVIPRFEILKSGGNVIFAANLVIETAAEAGTQLDRLSRELEQLKFMPLIKEQPAIKLEKRFDAPNRTGWGQNLRAGLELIQSGELQKVVLARKTDLHFDGVFDPLEALKAFRANHLNSYLFCFQPESAKAFIGSTPERLYRREGKTLYSEAVAGTRPRGKDSEEDARLGQELLSSRKDRWEHQLVSDMVQDALLALGIRMATVSRNALLKLPHVQHLCTEMEGNLNDHLLDGDILSHLHPTPAVGGSPQQISIEKIAALEPFDRGWYAGPVGWIGQDSAEFAVAIRSALFSGNTISLFAGAGIVPGSVPELEWDELESKLLNFTKILNLA